MVLAESVQIDGSVVLAFLVVLGLLLAGYGVLLFIGTRVAYRTARTARAAGAGTGIASPLVPLAAIDAGLLALCIRVGGSFAIFLLSPTVLHAGAWLLGRADGNPQPPTT